jgi:hypothetical protein
MQGQLIKSKLAQHAYKEGNNICLKKAKVLQIELNVTYTKLKESDHMSLVAHPNSQFRLDLSPLWTPIIEVGVRKLQFCLCFYVCVM